MNIYIHSYDNPLITLIRWASWRGSAATVSPGFKVCFRLNTVQNSMTLFRGLFRPLRNWSSRVLITPRALDCSMTIWGRFWANWGRWERVISCVYPVAGWGRWSKTTQPLLLSLLYVYISPGVLLNHSSKHMSYGANISWNSIANYIYIYICCVNDLWNNNSLILNALIYIHVSRPDGTGEVLLCIVERCETTFTVAVANTGEGTHHSLAHLQISY